MRVAISGSHGLIGTALARALRTRGDAAVRLVRGGDDHNEVAIPWDPGSGTLDPSHLEDIDAVVHLAGAGIGDKRWSPDRKRELVHSRVSTGETLVEAITACSSPPAVLIGGSAIGIYGDRGDEVLTERSKPGTGFLADLCRQWEEATHLDPESGVRVAHIRTGIVIARDNPAIKKQLPLFKLGLGGRLGPGSQWTSWISIEDEIEAILHVLDNDVRGPVNLTAPEPVTNAGFAKTFARVLHRPAVLPVPSFAPALLLGREAVGEVLLASQRVIPEVLQSQGYRFTHPDLESALRAALGMPALVA
jgi:hypothetical protein